MMRTCSLAASIFAGAALMTLSTVVAAQESATTSGGWAVVKPDGRLGANHNVVRVNHRSPGVYQVKFNQPVKRCAATASIGGSAKTIVPGYIVVRRHADIVSVHTFAVVTLLPADFKFDLTLTCPSA